MPLRCGSKHTRTTQGTVIRPMGPYEVALTRKPIQKAYLRVEGPAPSVRVSAPLNMPLAQIERFVLGKSAWIDARHAAFATSLPASPRRGHVAPNGTLLLWGERVRLEDVSPLAAQRLDAGLDQAANTLLKQELSRQLLARARPLVDVYEPRMQVHVNELRCKDMQTRWGTCNAAARRLWLATSLAHYAPDCLELIVVHEMCHLLERGHGPRFKELMSRYLPTWREREARLRHMARNR